MTATVLEHELDLHIPYKTFLRNIADFAQKHKLEGLLVYATNSDGRFRLELKENKKQEEYVLRLFGWVRDKTLELRRIYAAERFSLTEGLLDLLDLIEVWAVDHSGTFYFKYLDLDEPLLDAYDIRKGLEKEHYYTDHELQELLERYGRA